MLSCGIWFSAPSFGVGGGLERLCVCRAYSADGAGMAPTAPYTLPTRLPFIKNVFCVTNLQCSSGNMLGLNRIGILSSIMRILRVMYCQTAA